MLAFQTDNGHVCLCEQYPAVTIIENKEGRCLGGVEAPIWPPEGSVIELPDGDAIVRAVRLRLHPPGWATVVVEVD